MVDKGYDPQFGARPLRRTLQRFVELPLSKRLLKGEFHGGDTVTVTVVADEDTPGQNRLDFEHQPEAPIPVELPVRATV